MRAKWITDHSRLEQLDEPNKWLVLDNELFQDEDGLIYLVPRNFKTDNYTIPDWMAWLAGNKSKYDTRPSHLHDTFCAWHCKIRVRLTEKGLRRFKYLRVHGSKLICENIPTKFLEIIPISKIEANNIFERAMKATGHIPLKTCIMYRLGVMFNIGWLKYKPFDLGKIYTLEQN